MSHHADHEKLTEKKVKINKQEKKLDDKISEQMSKSNSGHGFISLLYSIGNKPLDLWSKCALSADGRVRRVEDKILNGDRVIEIAGPENSPLSTFISCPKSPYDCLNIRLPVLVLVLKNLGSRVQIDFQIVDEENIRRKFLLSNGKISGKSDVENVDYSTARLSLNLEADWNRVEIDLKHLCRTIFRTEYKALQRLIVYQNCCVRRIYLQDRHYENEETPIQLCQAFFDMYMLKWGINLVEKSCQTKLTYGVAKNDDSRLLAGPLSQENKTREVEAKVEGSLSSAEEKKDTKKLDKKLDKAAEIAGKKILENRKKVRELGKIASTSPIGSWKSVKKNVKESEPEGEIFQKWPYNYLKVQQVARTSLTKSQQIEPKSFPEIPENGPDETTKLSTDCRFPLMIPIGIPLPPEVEKAALEATSKDVKVTRSKLLTTDEAVTKYLELRHVINSKLLENFRPRGLTMTEVELSIYNSKNRRNSYGQGKIVEKHRRKIDKACNIIENEKIVRKRAKTAL